MQGHLLIDINNIGFASQSKTVLTANGMQVQAIFGVIRIIRTMLCNYPTLTPIALHDGSSWRKSVFPAYKENREANNRASDKKKLEVREAYKAQRPFIKTALGHLGVRQFSAFNMEADDLASIMVKRDVKAGKKVLMITADADWIQLVQSGVAWKDPIHNKRVTNSTMKDVVGVDTTEKFLQVKALCGDTGDNIPGVGGIGKVGAVELVNTYGSVHDFLMQYLDGTIDGKVPKKFADFAEDEKKHEIFRRNMVLMDLNSKHIPKPVGVNIENNQLNEEAFREFCHELNFLSILKNFDEWVQPFEGLNNV